MSHFMSGEEALYVGTGLVILALVLFIWWNLPRSGRQLGRSGVIAIGAVWTAACTFEYWLLGPHSAMGRGDTFYVSVPWLYYTTHIHEGGAYAHAYAGGVDAGAGVALGVQAFSIERLIYSALPPWMAISVMNIGAISLAYAGGYRVARKAFELSRGKAAIVGIVASGTHYFNLASVTGGLGWGTAFLPWGFYLLCLRADRPRYFATVGLFALLYSGATGIIHSLPAFFSGLLISSCFLPWKNRLRLLLACMLFALICVLNWVDLLYAFVQFGGESARSNATIPLSTLREHLSEHWNVLLFPAGLFALATFVWRRDRRGICMVFAFWASYAIGHVLALLPWQATGIPFFAAYRWPLVSEGYLLVGLLMVSRVLTLLEWSPPWRIHKLLLPSFSAFYFPALAVLAVAHHQLITVQTYRENLGVSTLTQAPLLGSEAWRAPEPFRVVTDYALLPPGLVTAYRLDTFDGSVQAFSRRQNSFYGWAVLRPPDPTPHTHVHFLRMPRDSALFATNVNLDALRIANVRYILSARPLADPTVRLVAHHVDPPPDPSTFAGWLRRWAPGESVHSVYISEIESAWPRAFAPSAIDVARHGIEGPAFYDELLARSTTPSMLIAPDDLGRLHGVMPVVGVVQLQSFCLTPDGFDLTLAPGPVTDPGLSGAVVVNAPYSALWQATSRGKSLPVVPVNGIHMAVVAGPDDRQVELRYQRRTLRTALFGRPAVGR